MEGDLHVVRSRTFVCISIHSLRMEGDLIEGMKQAQGITISIHSLRMEGDDTLPYNRGLPPHGGRPRLYESIRNPSTFQSTPSAWRETLTAVLLNRK